MNERTDLNTSIVDRAIQSIQDGNKEESEKYVKQLQTEGFVVKDLLVDMINMLTTYIGKEYGEEKLKTLGSSVQRATGSQRWSNSKQ